jgi:hypothetical protein
MDPQVSMEMCSYMHVICFVLSFPLSLEMLARMQFNTSEHFRYYTYDIYIENLHSAHRA